MKSMRGMGTQVLWALQYMVLSTQFRLKSSPCGVDNNLPDANNLARTLGTVTGT